MSHDLSNARYLAEKTGGRIGVMYLGELVEIGPVEQIIHDPQHPYTQALRWATPELGSETEEAESPIRSIDIPNPKNPPAGCRYHARCPEAQKVCREREPELIDVGEDASQPTACFRAQDDPEYWESESITDDAS